MTGPTDAGGPRGSPPRLAVHLLVFAGFLGLTTWKLLEPRPVPEALRGDVSVGGAFVRAKAFHCGAFAFLAAVGATLPVTRRWRRAAVGLVVLFGPATELAQHAMAVGRHGQVMDVLFDWVGVAAGLAPLSWARRRGW